MRTRRREGSLVVRQGKITKIIPGERTNAGGYVVSGEETAQAVREIYAERKKGGKP